MRRWILSLLLLALFFGGCGQSQPLFSISGDNRAAPRGGALLNIVTEMDSFEVEWRAQAGAFDKKYGESVVWIAPKESGEYLITARIIGELFIDEASYMITVVDEPSLEIMFKELDTEKSSLYITFMNMDEKRRAIVDFAFYSFLWEDEGYQGRRITYLGQEMYRGSPCPEEMPIPHGSIYKNLEWSIERAKEAESFLPWVYYIAFDDGATWNLYDGE